MVPTRILNFTRVFMRYWRKSKITDYMSIPAEIFWLLFSVAPQCLRTLLSFLPSWTTIQFLSYVHRNVYNFIPTAQVPPVQCSLHSNSGLNNYIRLSLFFSASWVQGGSSCVKERKKSMNYPIWMFSSPAYCVVVPRFRVSLESFIVTVGSILKI